MAARFKRFVTSIFARQPRVVYVDMNRIVIDDLVKVPDICIVRCDGDPHEVVIHAR